jgi:hypothetical protein
MYIGLQLKPLSNKEWKEKEKKTKRERTFTKGEE